MLTTHTCTLPPGTKIPAFCCVRGDKRREPRNLLLLFSRVAVCVSMPMVRSEEYSKTS